MAVEGQHPRERIAVGRVTRVADVHRPGRVGRYEFDQDPLGRLRVARSELPARAQGRRQRAPAPGVGHEQVHEARPGDLVLLQILAQLRGQLGSQALRQDTRRHAHARRQQQRRIGREVAELRALGALQRDRRALPGAVAGLLRQ
jgi:hypothetical protein